MRLPARLKPLTPAMRDVLVRLQAGERLFYSTSMLDDSSPWFDFKDGDPRPRRVRGATTYALHGRRLVDFKYRFPVGEIVLTAAGRALDTSK